MLSDKARPWPPRSGDFSGEWEKQGGARVEKAMVPKKTMSGENKKGFQAREMKSKTKTPKFKNFVLEIFEQKFSKKVVQKNVAEKVVQKYPDKMFRKKLSKNIRTK